MWLLETLISGSNNIILSVWTEFFSFIETFFNGDVVLNVLKMSAVETAASVTTGLSTVFLGILGGKHIVSTYILETDGDKDMDPLQFLVKTSVAIAMIQISNFLTVYLIKLSQLVCKEIIADNAYTILEMQNVSDLTYKVMNTQVAPIYVLVFAICLLILLVKAAIRIAEIAAMKVLLPLFCCDIITPSRERWNTFIVSYLITIFGYILQLLLLNLSFKVFVLAENSSSLIMALGCLFFSIKAPKFLERFVYSTGLGQSVGSSAIYMAPQLLRLLK